MNYELQNIKERFYYAFLCITWRQSTDHSRRVYIEQNRNRQITNEK